MCKNKYLNICLTFILVIFSLHFFEQRIFTNRSVAYVHFIFLFIIVSISLPFLTKYIFYKGFSFPVALLSISTIISVIMAYYSWDQSILDSLKASMPYMVWIFFFYLLYSKIPITTIERITIVYGILYIALYLFQLCNTDVAYFGWKDEFKEDRGIIRVLFPGGGVFYLTSFIALNKLTSTSNSTKKLNIFWFVLAACGIIIPILQVTRQNIIVMLLIYSLHIIRETRTIFKISLLIAAIVGIFYIPNSSNTLILGLKEVQQETNLEGKNYIRVLAAEYFVFDFSPETINIFLGNGVPGGDSYFKLFEENLKEIYGFYLSDVGIVGAYAQFGLLSIIAFTLIFIKSIIYKVPPEYLYLKYYLLYLFVTSLTSSAVYHYDFLITNVFVLYCFQVAYIKDIPQQNLLDLS